MVYLFEMFYFDFNPFWFLSLWVQLSSHTYKEGADLPLEIILPYMILTHVTPFSVDVWCAMHLGNLHAVCSEAQQMFTYLLFNLPIYYLQIRL